MASFNPGFNFAQSQPAAAPFGASSPSLFGSNSSAPFGSQAASPFGQTASAGFGGGTPAFGTQSTPAFGSSGFGATGSSFGGFGASQTPAFGQSAPAFGASPAPAFGAQSTPMFGAAQSTSAFGSTAFGSGGGAFGGGGGGFGAPRPAFGASTPAFGSQPFGAASTPAFGASPAATPTFGQTGAFGASTSTFGASPGFGQQQQQAGTRQAPWRKTASGETSNGKSDGSYHSISAMPEYAGKSFEELRWEDYQAGVKGGSGQASPGGFGQTSGGFGATPSQPFGTPASGFGTPASTPAFGQASTPAFGSSGFGASPPAFGASPGFGQSSTPAFGQASAPAFGSTGFGASNPAFGAPQSTPAFGASPSPNPFGAQSTPAFGGSSGFGAFGSQPQSTPAFGSTPQSTPAFGSGGFGTGFGQSSASFGFGGASTPAFGHSSTPAFSFNTGGGFGTPQAAPAFGASTPASGFGASAPAFGSTPLFGQPQQQQQKPGGGFSFAGGNNLFGQSAAAPAFGQAASTPAFGQSQPSIFGSAPTPGFGSAGGASQPAFSFPGAFGQAPQQQQQPSQPQQQLVIADPNHNPYGILPAPPAIPDYPSGLAVRPGTGSPLSRTSPLLAPRSVSRFSAQRVLPRAGPPRLSSGAAAPSQPTVTATVGPDRPIFVPRSNPRHLFLQTQLPSTESASAHTSSTATPQSNGKQPSQPSRQQQQPQQKQQQEAGPSKWGPDKDVDNGHSPGRQEWKDRHEQHDMQQEEEDEEDQHMLNDNQISRLLPRLGESGFTISPTQAQLAMMVREGGPAALRQVANFTVQHRVHGSIKWLEPVDVSGLQLADLVIISRSNVDVYPEGVDKPALGEGLNKPAEVTLNNIYKLDKQTGERSKDAKQQKLFERKLKESASKQNTEFISYNTEQGIWKFRVEHFSKYGLMEDSDEEQDDTNAKQQAQAKQVKNSRSPADMPQQKAKAAHGYGFMDDDDEDMADDDDVSDQTGEAGLDHEDAAEQQQEAMSESTDQAGSDDLMLDDDAMPSAQPEPFQRSPELALALPSAYNQDPAELLGMQHALFGTADDSLPGRSKRAKSAGLGAAPFIKPVTSAEGQAPNAWKRSQPALQPPSAMFQEDESAPHTSLAAIAHPRPSQVRAAAVSSTAAASGCLVDAGLMLGQSCRAGWAPNGTLFMPGSGAGKATSIISKRLSSLPNPVHSRSRDTTAKDLEQEQRKQRAAWQSMLELHLDHSSPNTAQPPGQQPQDGECPYVPQWQLRCRREGELNKLYLKLTSILHASLKELKDGNSVQQSVLQQQIQTWELLNVLYSAIKDTSENQVESLPTLVDMRRREGLSSWLQACAKHGIHEGVQQTGISAFSHIAQLLSGQQTAAAAVAAAATGNVRLATLIAQGGGSSRTKPWIQQQLRVWEEQGFDEHIEPDCKLVYQLLAGQVQEVIPALDLDWRRAFGLHFWYQHASTATTAEVLQSYSESATASEGVPGPQPLYQELSTLAVSPPASATGVTAVDFQLLRLSAGDLPGPDVQQGLAELLRPSGATPDPLDHSFVWQLQDVLQAINAITLVDSVGHPPAQVFQLHLSLIAQLEAIGQMPHWAVFVALHVPDHPSQACANLRSALVHELIMRHGPFWASNSGAREFLLHQLQLPGSWLEQSLTQWAHYRRDESGQLQHLMQAKLWSDAHQLFILHVAPQLLLGSHHPSDTTPGHQQQQLESRLQQLLQQLAPHAEEVGAAAEASTSGRISWALGARLYLTYYSLRDQFRFVLSAGQRQAQQQSHERTSSYLSFVQDLQAAIPHWGSGVGAVLRQVVLSSLSAEAAQWLLKDVSDVWHDNVQTSAHFGIDLTSSMVQMQLAASRLAECESF